MPGSTISDSATDDSVLERDSAAPGLEQNTATAEKPDTVAVDTEEDVYAVITAALARRYSKEHADEKSLSAVQGRINHYGFRVLWTLQCQPWRSRTHRCSSLCVQHPGR